MAKYTSKYQKRFLRWKKTTRNHVERLKEAGHWHGLPRLTWFEWKQRIAEFDSRCGYCLEKFDEDLLWLEHIVGVNDGGPHRLPNVIPSCQKCNQQKGSKSLWDFQQITVEELFQRMNDHLEMLKDASET